jgi:hypothetical protein
MNKLDSGEREVPENSADKDVIVPSVKTEKKKKYGSGGPIFLFFIFGLAASLIVGWVIFPKLLYSRKKQPINYNHVLHLEEVEDSCDSCHFFREDGSFSGVPRLVLCVDCHEEVQGETPDEAKFVEEYMAKGIEVPWLVYSRQPDHVFFSHAAHVKLVEIDCAECHGSISESEKSRVYEVNRITGYSRDIWGKNIAGFKRNTWDRMKMDDCADCHAKMIGTDETSIKKPFYGLFTNLVKIALPGTEGPGRKTSAQTRQEACFVCHK